MESPMTRTEATVEVEQGRLTILLEPSKLWILGLALDDEGQPIGAATEPSYLEPCACPGDCQRDHANE